MSGRRRSTLSPSLFPFLAVLVCTLGTLILLLALVAQSSTESAEQQARAEVAKAQLSAPKIDSSQPELSAQAVASMIQEQQFRVQQLVAFRDQQTADLEVKRDQLTHLEDHINRLREKLKHLSDEVDRAFGDQISEPVDQTAIAKLKQQIEQEQATVDKLRGESENRTPRVVIVPHKGPNGTDRRPVYLECTDAGLTIWPEGAQITASQLDNSADAANPLDAALRAIRLHAMQTYGDTTPPYPLLVVRPEGIETYAAARQAMQDWDDQFGYELVPADTKLAYSKPDPNLKQRIDLAISQAVAKQQIRSALADRGGGVGGFGGGASGKMPVLSAASLDRAGRAGGFQRSRDDYEFGSSYKPIPANNRSSFSASPNEPSGYGNGLSPQERQWQDQMRSAAGELRSADGNELPSGQLAGGNLPGSGGRSQQTGDHSGSQLNAVAGQADQKSGELNSGVLNAEELSLSGPKSNPANPAEPDSSGQALAEANSNAMNPSADSAPPANSGQPQPYSSLPTTGSTARSRQGDINRAASGNGGPQSSSSGSSSAAMPPQAASLGGAPQSPSDQAATPQINLENMPPQRAVRRQGRNWALPTEMAQVHGNAIVRTIRVQCYEDRFVLLPPASGGPTEMFGFSDGNIDRASLELATAVRDRVERWGAALPGGRWQPRLDVEVMPDGQTRFHQLRSLMLDSGVDVTGRAAQ